MSIKKAFSLVIFKRLKESSLRELLILDKCKMSARMEIESGLLFWLLYMLIEYLYYLALSTRLFLAISKIPGFKILILLSRNTSLPYYL